MDTREARLAELRGELSRRQEREARLAELRGELSRRAAPAAGEARLAELRAELGRRQEQVIGVMLRPQPSIGSPYVSTRGQEDETRRRLYENPSPSQYPTYKFEGGGSGSAFSGVV